jgi:guanylate kinase
MSLQNIFIVSGPSGVGEDSVIDGLAKRLPLERVITTTTREPREGESQGNPYYFITHKKFEQKIQAGDFVEYAQEYNNNYYGVTQEEIKRVTESRKIGIWKIEWKGVITAKKLYPNIIAIFLTVRDLSILEQRIRRRNGSVTEAYIQERMEYTKEWLKHTDIYDYIVHNEENKLEETITHVEAIIRGKTSIS